MAVIASTRRAILAAPLASVPAVASPVSHDLAQLIAQHDAQRAIMDAEEVPSRDLCREAGRLRALIAGYQSNGWPDTMAKAACLARLWPLDEAEQEMLAEVETGHAYLECMALAIACEVMRYGEGALCT